MIKNIVYAIKEQAEHIKGIKFFRYEGQDLINAQNNNSTIQIWVEDNIFSEYIVTKDLIKVQLNIDILDKLNEDNDVLDIHNNTNNICIILMKLIQENYKYMVNIYDYNMITVSRYTDDELYGTRLSLYLHIPSPINECNITDYIDETNEYEVYYYNDDISINVPQIDIDKIDIKPIKLKRNE